MNLSLKIFLLISLFAFLIVIFRFLTSKRLNLKYTLIWMISVAGMIVIVIFPRLIDTISHAIGVASSVNTVFLLAGLFSLVIIFTLTVIVSHINTRIYKLAQMQSIVEKRLRELEKNEKDNIGRL